MIVGYLTVVYHKDVTEKQARYLTDEIADEALSFPHVDALKCDIGVLDGGTEAEFWAEAEGK